MSINDLFQYYSLSEAAAKLDIHPFDIARYLAIQQGGMPNELRLTPQKISQIAHGMGLQNWWSEPMQIEDAQPKRRLVRELARRVFDADWNVSTRADNLNRGLAGAEYAFVRRCINVFIKCDLLAPEASLTGLNIRKGNHPNWEETMQSIIEAKAFPDEFSSLLS